MIPAPQKAADEQMAAPLFRCAECDEPVIVYGQRFFRTCEHTSAQINATPAAAKVVTGGN